MVISPLQRLRGLGEQRGEGDPSEPWHGSQDRHVALLAMLPRRVLLAAFRRCRFRGRDELVAELVELAVRGVELLIDQADAGGHGVDMSRRRRDHAGRHRQRLLPQDLQHLGRLQTADTVGFEEPLDCRQVQPGGLRRGRRLAPQVEKPRRREVVAEGQHLRVITPQLLAHAVGQTTALALQILGHPRPFAQLDDHRVVDRQAPEGVAIGAQAVGLDMGVAAIVLGAGDGEAVAEPIELLGIDRIHLETAFQQCFDDRAVRHLDRHRDRRLVRLRCSTATRRRAPPARRRHGQTRAHRQSCRRHRSGRLDAPGSPSRCRQTTRIPSVMTTPSSAQPDRRDDRQSLYRRSKRNLPQDFRRGQPAGVQVRSRCPRRRVGSATPGKSARSDQSENRPVHDRFKGTGPG